MNERDQQSKRASRGLSAVYILLGIVIVCLLILVLRPQKPPVVNNYIGKKGDPGQSIIGPTGTDGLPGMTGVQGIAGQNGSDGSTQIFNNTINLPVPGPKGDQGDVGSPGEREIMRVNSDCVLQSQYEGDDAWNDLAQLPKPCEADDGE